MRLLIVLLALAAGCSEPGGSEPRQSLIDVTGRIEYRSLDETSGLASSNRDPELLWAVNDDGPPVIYAIGTDGRKRGKVDIGKARHRDWEDAASFVLDGTAWLLVADIGDNDARRRDVTIYVIGEPEPGADHAEVAWSFDFSYPDGPRDAESAAVDIDNRRILVLSKHDVPPRLYALPLEPEGQKRVMAEFLGVVDSLPQPTRSDVNRAPLTDNWHWQATGMSISADNRRAMILTYGGVYYYARADNEDWTYALRRPPLGLSLGRLPGAESIALGADGRTAYVTTEGRRAPLLHIDLGGVNGNETEN